MILKNIILSKIFSGADIIIFADAGKSIKNNNPNLIILKFVIIRAI